MQAIERVGYYTVDLKDRRIENYEVRLKSEQQRNKVDRTD